MIELCEKENSAILLWKLYVFFTFQPKNHIRRRSTKQRWHEPWPWMLTEDLLLKVPAMEGVEDLEPTPEGAARSWTWSVFAGAWATMSLGEDGVIRNGGSHGPGSDFGDVHHESYIKTGDFPVLCLITRGYLSWLISLWINNCPCHLGMMSSRNKGSRF